MLRIALRRFQCISTKLRHEELGAVTGCSDEGGEFLEFGVRGFGAGRQGTDELVCGDGLSDHQLVDLGEDVDLLRAHRDVL